MRAARLCEPPALGPSDFSGSARNLSTCESARCEDGGGVQRVKQFHAAPPKTRVFRPQVFISGPNGLRFLLSNNRLRKYEFQTSSLGTLLANESAIKSSQRLQVWGRVQVTHKRKEYVLSTGCCQKWLYEFHTCVLVSSLPRSWGVGVFGSLRTDERTGMPKSAKASSIM